MAEDQNVVATKYDGSVWQSFVESKPLPDSSFRRRYDAERVGKSYAENNDLIHRVYSPQGNVLRERNYAQNGKRGGDSGFLGSFGEIFEIIIHAVTGLFRWWH
jgi:hypothetical protein